MISCCENTLWTWFESVCRAHSKNAAIRMDRRILTYHELWNQVVQLTRTLVNDESTSPIAIACRDIPLIVTGMMASLSVGRPFLVLNDQLPLARRQAVLKNSGSSVLLTDPGRVKEVQSWSNPQCSVRCIEDSTYQTVALPKIPMPSHDSPACIIYTSGTTRGPTGVLHSHRSLMHAVQIHTRALSIVQEDRLSLITSISHMAGVMDILRSVLNGATLVPYDLRTKGLGCFTDYLELEKISVLHASPATFRAIVDSIDRNRFCTRHVRIVHLGGDAVSRTDFDGFRSCFPPSCILSCGYGGTEMGPVSRTLFQHGASLPVNLECGGHIFEGKTVLITDDDGRSLEPGVPGEIRVRSPFLAEGYWTDPTSTAESFSVVDEESDEREYRTGDLGYIREDGCLVCCGRLDSMVKIDGYRVNTNEIEATLLRYEDIEQAAVLAEPRSDLECRLVAYVSIHSLLPERNVVKEIRSFLRKYLPNYMIPSKFIILSELPKTPSGKVDRKSLAIKSDASVGYVESGGLDQISLTTSSIEGSSSNEDHNDWLRKIISIWRDVFGLKQVGINDDFFELGGTSMLAIKIVERIRKEFGVDIPVATIFNRSTPWELCIAIADGHSVRATRE